MEGMTQKPSPSSWASPLGIIALFLTVTETVTGLVVSKATGGVQVALTAYVIALPLLVLAIFTVILWVKPFVLYPPSEFGGSGASLAEFVSAMKERPTACWPGRGLERVAESRRSSTRPWKSALASRRGRAFTDGVGLVAANAAKLGEVTIAKIDEQLLTVDTTPIGGVKKVRKIFYDEELTVSQFLDDIYFSIADQVQTSSYGTQWVLQDVRTKQIFADMGRSWAAGRGKPLDDRKLAEVGIKPGMWLQAVRPSRPV